tara:strand:- start:5392 stop:5628 length:237 start_codon:yes stop_codon:yes gene_type:complete
MKLKTCNHCLETKPDNKIFFVNNRRSSDKTGTMCRECHKSRMKVINKKNYKENREASMIRTYKYNDTKNDRENDLDVE